ncbi:MAG: Collagen triple helix repeat protein [Bacteroidetes bacterium]|nr:Collagen triple helix repeat protein [Bacteroidota bacterium]
MSEKKPRSGKAKKTELPTEKKPTLKNKKDGPKALNPLTQNTSQFLNYLVVNSITGPQGPAGKDGTNGTNGINGSIGPQGPTGNDGTNGTNGTNGINGSIGPQGPTGNDGTNGTNGTNGINGSIGPQGPTGNDGTNGTNGTNGINGSIGPQGPTGNDGTNGTNGTNGINGSIGPQGPTGNDGTNGTNGINGSIGPQGPTGNNGTNGTNGTNGINGSIGPQGPTGNNGTNGTNGTNGINGSIGPQGPTGNNGTNGINGSIGPQGPTGPGIEKDTIVLSKNQSVPGYIPLNITVKGQPVERGYWNQCPEMALLVDFPAVAADDQYIYLIGGLMKWTPNQTNVVQRFELSTKQWKMQPYPTPELVYGAAAMLFNGKLMYAGGFVSSNLSNKTYMLQGNQWIERGKLNEAVADAASVVFRGIPYVFGGKMKMNNTFEPCNYTQKYTDNPSGWSRVKSAPVAFALATAAVYKDQIYLFGGYIKVNGIEQLMPVLRYNPATDVWDAVVGYNPAGNVRGSAAMIDGIIYYAGGNNQLTFNIPSSDTFSYNLKSQKTEPMSSKLKIPRTETSAVIMGKQMFVMGGTGYTGPAGTFYTEYIDLDPDENTFFLHKKS